jgi:hypothetical protein
MLKIYNFQGAEASSSKLKVRTTLGSGSCVEVLMNSLWS